MTDRQVIEHASAALAEEFELDVEKMRPEALFRDDRGLDSLESWIWWCCWNRRSASRSGRIRPSPPFIPWVLHAYIVNKKREMESRAGSEQ